MPSRTKLGRMKRGGRGEREAIIELRATEFLPQKGAKLLGAAADIISAPIGATHVPTVALESLRLFVAKQDWDFLRSSGSETTHACPAKGVSMLLKLLIFSE